MIITPVPTSRVEYPTQTSLFEWVITSLANYEIGNRDILVISSKIISYFESNLVDLNTIQAEEEARQIAKRINTSPQLIQLVLDEADELVSESPWVLLTLKNGIYCANAGVDTSNVPSNHAITWPKDPYQSVNSLRLRVMDHFQLQELAVIMIDSVCVPGRRGTLAVSVSSDGIEPVQRLENTKDLFGNILKYSSLNIADSIATAANLAMGESTESCPLAMVRNAAVVFADGNKNDEILISSSEDLYQ